MNQPSPAIVAQGAVRRLPRLALWLFCAAYVLPGLFGREPWKSADMTAFGFMQSLALGNSPWLSPHLLGQAPQVEGLLPYWLGAWAIQGLPFLHNDAAVRLVFALLLGLTLAATWYGVYYLARSPQAQPVAFAFGGEANPADYARAMADGGLLACIATLGLAQLSHETTPAAVQLCCTALCFFAFAALPYRVVAPALCASVGLAGLALSGAPVAAVLLGAGGLVIHALERPVSGDSTFGEDVIQPDVRLASHRLAIGWGIFLLLAGVIFLASQLSLWRWRIELPELLKSGGHDWHGIARLLLWFTWPAWPLALWTLWRWRRQVGQIFRGRMHRHLALPLLFAAVAVGSTLTTTAGDRALLLALPALAALAAFSLPTLGRTVAALVDWFTLLFFTGCAIVIWVVWIAMQTGVPPQPAANVARLAPGFVPSFSLGALLLAVAATAVWAWLVNWRVGRHRAAIWKSMVLPAGGAALCWLLLMTLWLPLLDFARSYTALTRQISRVVGDAPCVEAHGLDPGQIAAFSFMRALNCKRPPRAPVARGCWSTATKWQASHLPSTSKTGRRSISATAPPTATTTCCSTGALAGFRLKA